MATFGKEVETYPTWESYVQNVTKRNNENALNNRLKGSAWGQSFSTPDLSVGANPFTQYTNVKEPEFDRYLRDLAKESSGMSTAPESNRPQFGTYTKNEGLQSRINRQFDVNDLDTEGKESARDFASKLLESEPSEMAQFGKESDAINNIFNPGGMEAQLASNRRKSRIAGTQSLNNQIGSIAARANAGRLLGGTDSSVNRMAMAAAGEAGLGLNRYLTEQERADINALNQLRLGAAGRINSLRDAILMRRQIPIQLQQQVAAQNLARFGTLAGLTGQNEMAYQLPTAYDLAARKQALISEALRNVLGNTEYTYEAPFERETGAFPQSQPRTQGPSPRRTRPVDPNTGWEPPWPSQESVPVGGGTGARAGGAPSYNYPPGYSWEDPLNRGYSYDAQGNLVPTAWLPPSDVGYNGPPSEYLNDQYWGGAPSYVPDYSLE